MTWKARAAAACVLCVMTSIGSTVNAAPAQAMPLAAPTPPVGVTVAKLSGRGSRVLTVRVTAAAPLVFTATHNGSSNFIVEFVRKRTSDLLINEIGDYQGQVALERVKAGRYRIKVDADGPWSITVTRPIPGPSAKAVPAKFKGSGARVLRIRAKSGLQPVITARHKGRANFIVMLIGYGTLTGSELLFNEIGKFKGQTLVNDMPAGPYLLTVDADGAWTIKFSR